MQLKRPGSEVEEKMFTRLVQLDRLTEKSRQDEMLELFGPGHNTDPDRYWRHHTTYHINTVILIYVNASKYDM